MDMQSRPTSKTRNFPRAITLTAAGTQGDTSEELPDNVQHVEPFKGLIARGHIRVLEVKPPAAEPEPAPAAPTPKAAPPVSSSAPDDAPKVEDKPPADAGTDTPTTASPTGRKPRGEK